MSDRFISIEGIARSYPKSGGGYTSIFENLWLSMYRGEFICVIGHPAAGKPPFLIFWPDSTLPRVAP